MFKKRTLPGRANVVGSSLLVWFASLACGRCATTLTLMAPVLTL